MPAGTYIFEDANTAAVDVAFKWRVVAPTDVPAAPPADFPNATYPSGVGAIAENATNRRATFVVNTLPNLVVTADRYFDVEVYDVTPSDATIANPRVRTKIVEDDVSTAPTLTIIYGPVDGAADSPQLNFESNRQEFGRKYRAGAPKWKAQVGGVRAGDAQYSFVSVIMDDAGKTANINGKVFAGAGEDQVQEPINVNYADYTFKEGDVTVLTSDANGLRYTVGNLVLWSVPFNTVWRGKVVSNATIQAEMPGKFGASNAHEVVANGIYAGRLGPVQ